MLLHATGILLSLAIGPATLAAPTPADATAMTLADICGPAGLEQADGLEAWRPRGLISTIPGKSPSQPPTSPMPSIEEKPKPTPPPARPRPRQTRPLWQWPWERPQETYNPNI